VRRRLRFHLTLADLLTIGNGVMGFNAILTLSIETPYFPNLSDAVVAGAFIALGVAFDALDGVAARKYGSSLIGPDLDSLSDLVTFCVAPAVLLVVTYGHLTWYPAILVATLVVVFGMARLARFNSTAEKESRTFQGLPTPLCAAAIVLLVLFDVIVLRDVDCVEGVCRYGAAYGVPILVLSGVLAFLMVSNIAYPKARERLRYFTAAAVVVAIVVAAGVLVTPDFTTHLLLAGLAFTLAVVAIGPVFTLRGVVRSARTARRARRAALLAMDAAPSAGDAGEEEVVEEELLAEPGAAEATDSSRSP